ncbi:hypothetical protein B566_EDAN013825 [Ephemera danica]|nr:hypothetical protein B566_EDAN013825 [Ephemera danica]
MSDKKFPYLITSVEEKTNAKLLADFHGERRNFVQVGPKKFLLPSRFEELATELYNFQLRPDDVWIRTFPRSGTTLICELVWLLKNNLDFETAKKMHVFDRIPFFERAMQYSHELMAETLQRVQDDTEMEDKTVCIIRNPKDTVVSFYHLNRLQTLYGYKGDFYTPYWEQIKEAWQLRNHPNFLFLFYENVVKDLPGTVRQVAEFLDKTLTEANVQRLAEHLNIDNCRQNPSYNMDLQSFRAFMSPGEQGFVRNGAVGGWRHEGFDAKLSARADAWITENVTKIPGNFQFPTH